MKLYNILILLIFISTFRLQASPLSEDYRFKRIDVEKGLSNSEVKAIYKDSNGFVWFGTSSGLNRFDGHEIKILKQELHMNADAISNNDINNIQESDDGELWLSTRTGFSIYNPSSESFIPNVNEIIENYSGTHDILDIYIDLGKNLWFITSGDIRLYEIKTKQTVIMHQGEQAGLSRGRITDIKQGKNCYWFLFDSGLLECMDAQTHKVIYRDAFLVETEKIKNEVNMKIFVDSSGDVWIYGINIYFGLAYLKATTTQWAIYSTYSQPPYQISNDIIAAIEEDEKGNIWVGTDHGGVNIINKKTGEITVLYNDESKLYTIAQNTVKCMYRDNTNVMWLGTFKKGVCYYHESIFKFKAVSDNIEIPFSDINCFYETPEGNIWIGTNGGGLIYFDRKAEQYRVYNHIPGNPNTPAGNVIVSLESDLEGRLWIGYYLDGMDCYDGKTFVHYNRLSANTNVLTDDNAWTMHCDKNGLLWIGTLRGGVVVVDTYTGERVKHLSPLTTVYDIIETKNGEILVASQSGLLFYNEQTETLELFEEETFTRVQLDKSDINVLLEDSRKLLWIGTRNGLFCYNPLTGEITLFNEKNGLTSDLIQSILEDDEHNMWISTNRGLTYIRIATPYKTPGYVFHLQKFDSSEGLQNEQFNYNAAYFTSKSELVFGGSSGFNIFTPRSINYNPYPPTVVFTEFQIYNETITPKESYKGRHILEKSISQTKEIKIKHSDNYISFSFTALDYCAPDKVRYFYKLEGFNTQWLEADADNRKITYTNLNPGNYILKVKAINNDGIESKEPGILHIRVTPPFWKTAWAWLIYIIILINLLVIYRKRLAKKAERRLEYEKEKIRLAQKHEMDELKLRFFTNVSHEFRTPLTLILSPLEELMKKVKDPDEKDSLTIIQRNARQLLKLVNQLLDFRKLDVHRHTLQESIGDIVQFVKEQADLFGEMMERKEIRFSFSTPLNSLYMYFDADKLAKSIMNILSNAYKFTPSGGEIRIELFRPEENQIKIIVTDTGCGIPEESLERIFERFYQVKPEKKENYQGSGIGLHLTKEFIKLHGGNISAENVPQGGACFTIILPYREEALYQIQDSPVSSTDNTDENDSIHEESLIDKTPKLLIVEDNEELRTFLTSKLKDQYFILQADNGEEGLEVALTEIPDIIISDIMMPRMDGIEMSKKIKSDIRTSHIPLVLLTAKTGEESKLEGLRAGADDYITKPFNFEILSVKIRNLIEAQKRKQTLFGEQIRIEPSKITVSSLDEKLIKKALNYTEQNISNPDFSVEELSRELGMSRVHLYKKLSSLTGKTPIEFIRVVRLKRAAQLLKESQLTVSEIAYEVGFNNPKYFRKYFKDEFGVLPSQYEGKKEEI